jgi:tetratricopeptide (TPR) repeat protein
MRKFESITFNQNKSEIVSEEQKAEKILESEVNINSGLLKKIAENPTLRKAFYIVAFTAGLFVGKEAIAQQKTENNENLEGERMEIVIQEEQKDIELNLHEFTKYIENSKHFSEYPHSLMSWAAASEKPTEYQAQQIVELHDKISKLARSQEFKSTAELIAFINVELDSNFSSQESYVKLKDIFPEEKGLESKANFDCDSRAIMVSSILQNMNYTNKDVVMCEMEGHMVLYLKNENLYFETTTNKVIELSKEEKAQLNPIVTPEKYFGHLISNQATALALEVESNFFSGRIDKDKREQAIQKFKQAIELDSGNISAKLNLIYLLNRGEIDTEKLTMATNLHHELLSDLVYNYHGIKKPQEDESQILKVKPQQEISDYKPTLKDLSVKAIQESDYIKDKFNDYADFVYYKASNYDEAISIYKLLLESLPEDQKGSITADFHRIRISQSQFNSGNFDSYLAEVESTEEALLASKNAYHFSQNLSKLKAQELVANILSGRLIIAEDNIDTIIEKYRNDPVLGSFISGEEFWNANYIEPVEALKEWEGYENFKMLLKTHKKSKEEF